MEPVSWGCREAARTYTQEPFVLRSSWVTCALGPRGCSGGGGGVTHSPVLVLHFPNPALTSLSLRSLCHPRGSHQQSEEASGKVREGVGPCYYHPQGLGHVWGPQLLAPHDDALLHQCKHPHLPAARPWGPGAWERRGGQRSSREPPALAVGKRRPWAQRGESQGNCRLELRLPSHRVSGEVGTCRVGNPGLGQLG